MVRPSVLLVLSEPRIVVTCRRSVMQRTHGRRLWAQVLERRIRTRPLVFPSVRMRGTVHHLSVVRMTRGWRHMRMRRQATRTLPWWRRIGTCAGRCWRWYSVSRVVDIGKVWWRRSEAWTIWTNRRCIGWQTMRGRRDSAEACRRLKRLWWLLRVI